MHPRTPKSPCKVRNHRPTRSISAITTSAMQLRQGGITLISLLTKASTGTQLTWIYWRAPRTFLIQPPLSHHCFLWPNPTPSCTHFRSLQIYLPICWPQHLEISRIKPSLSTTLFIRRYLPSIMAQGLTVDPRHIRCQRRCMACMLTHPLRKSMAAIQYPGYPRIRSATLRRIAIARAWCGTTATVQLPNPVGIRLAIVLYINQPYRALVSSHCNRVCMNGDLPTCRKDKLSKISSRGMTTITTAAAPESAVLTSVRS